MNEINSVGNRIIFDNNGEIIFQTGEMQGQVIPRKEILSLDYIDLPYGNIDLLKFRVKSVDVSTKSPVLEEIIQEETLEQKRIRELEEDIMLLKAENELGGIL